jgi:transcriptional regulator with PAS, ATPase and Fis domain
VDVRIVAASNADLYAMARAGTFRQDLYYRLNVVKIALPALRERRPDIPLLVDHFIRRFNLRKDRDIQGVTAAALHRLMNHPFPGNVRELENIIEYAFIRCKGAVIDLAHLPPDLIPPPDFPADRLSDVQSREAETIRAILQRHPDSRPAAARALGMSRTTLWRKMKRYGFIDSESET